MRIIYARVWAHLHQSRNQMSWRRTMTKSRWSCPKQCQLTPAGPLCRPELLCQASPASKSCNNKSSHSLKRDQRTNLSIHRTGTWILTGTTSLRVWVCLGQFCATRWGSLSCWQNSEWRRLSCPGWGRHATIHLRTHILIIMINLQWECSWLTVGSLWVCGQMPTAKSVIFVWLWITSTTR